jgi:hypothetical protein
MTEAERKVYDQMSERDRAAVDALSPELRHGALVLWARSRGRFTQTHLDDSWKTKPRRETVDPEPDRRLPPERDDVASDDDGRYGP